MVAGTEAVRVEGWGDITITMDCEITPETPTGKRPFVLYEVAHVSSFTANVVSYDRFYDKRIFWDSQNNCLKFEGIMVGRTVRKFGQWVLEYNPVDPAMVYRVQPTGG